MSLEKEIEHFNRVKVSPDTGEIDTWDKIIFPSVIKKRQNEVILHEVLEIKPGKILDFGCGAGWLSRILSSSEYDLVGIDASSWLIRNAVSTPSQNSSFLVGDCMNLPFKDNSFDLILGFGILHHLDPEKGLSECFRVATQGAGLLLMEPNRLNPIAALGRKALHSHIHTEGEKSFSPRQLTRLLIESGWDIEQVVCLFPFSFALSYLLHWTNGKVNQFLKAFVPTNTIVLLERLVEAVPLLNRLCWLIVIRGEKRCS